MGGGAHGHVHVHGNHNNIKESDADMLNRIQRIETIKHNPNHWHMDPFNAGNIYQILGGAPAFGFGLIGGAITYGYYLN